MSHSRKKSRSKNSSKLFYNLPPVDDAADDAVDYHSEQYLVDTSEACEIVGNLKQFNKNDFDRHIDALHGMRDGIDDSVNDLLQLQGWINLAGNETGDTQGVLKSEVQELLANYSKLNGYLLDAEMAMHAALEQWILANQHVDQLTVNLPNPDNDPDFNTDYKPDF